MRAPGSRRRSRLWRGRPRRERNLLGFTHPKWWIAELAHSQAASCRGAAREPESFAAATLNKHDSIIRRSLGMTETQISLGTLNLHVLAGSGRTLVFAQQGHAPADHGSLSELADLRRKSLVSKVPMAGLESARAF